jgi:hypothetical protein
MGAKPYNLAKMQDPRQMAPNIKIYQKCKIHDKWHQILKSSKNTRSTKIVNSTNLAKIRDPPNPTKLAKIRDPCRQCTPTLQKLAKIQDPL